MTNHKESKTFLRIAYAKKFYLAALIAIGALVAGFLLVPDSGNVSAQRNELTQSSDDQVISLNKLPANDSGEVATRDMIGISFDLRSATDFSVYAEKGITDDGSSRIRGDVGVADGAKINGISRESVEGLVRDTRDVEGYDPVQAQKDINQAHSAMSQLPCVDVDAKELTGRTFTPGVYCLPAAELAGQMTLDGDGTFVFRVAGTLNAEGNSRIDLVNGAAAHNTFFVVDGDATLGEGVTFKGSIFAQNAISLGNGTSVEGRVISVKGEVEMSNNAVGGATGFIEICKQTTGDNANLLANRLFRFRIGALIKEVPVGQCTAPFEVPVGPTVIEELLTGNTTSGGTYSGNFQLVSVVRSNLDPPNPAIDTTLDGFNLPLRTANITVRPGGLAQQTVFTFTNRYAITGIIEICKSPLDLDVLGFFNYTVNFVPQQGSNPSIPLQVFTVPVGACSGPIAVTVPSASTTVPRQGDVRVNELSRTGFLFVGGNTNPATRLIGVNVINSGPIAGWIDARIVEGGINVQTTYNFFNRSVPGQVKVCKIAGPGITLNTPFTFDVTGTTTDNPAPPGPAVAPYAVTRTITVQAGPDNSTPNQLGGFCGIVPGTFVVGTQVRVTETGPNYVAGTQGATATFTNNTAINVPAGQPAVTSGPADPSSIPVTVGAFGNKSIEVELTGITHTWNGDIDAILESPAGQRFLFASDIAEAPRPNTPVTVSFRDDAAGLAPAAGPLVAGSYKPTNHPGLGSEPAATGNFFNAPPTGGDSFASAFGTNGLAMNGNWNLVITDDAGGDSGQISGGWKLTFRDLGFEIRVSRIRASSGPVTGSLAGKFAQTTVRRGFTEFEFANFVFRPGLLKVCKVAGPGVPQNTPFTFDVTVDTVNGLFPDFARSITVPAGPAAQGGFCRFVDGPYAPAINGFGTYNLNSRVTVTERAAPGVNVTAIDTNGASPVNNTANRTSTFNMIPDVTEVSFTNAGTPGPNPARTRYDFDGDGKADQSVFRPSEGNWYVLRSGDGLFGAVQWGLSTDTLASADFDNDGREDYAVMRDNMWYVLRSSDNGVMEKNFGLPGDRPVAGDWDGDGLADLAVYREGAQSSFYFLGTNNNPLSNISNRALGTTGDIPVPADYDGDGMLDAAVYRPSNGSWYILQSSNSQTRIVNFGIATDIPAPADVDGDSKADIIVFRDGIWYQFLSGNGTVKADQFGLAGDKPIPADYDGDGTADLAVYRNGEWHMLQSRDGYRSIGFGTASDAPIPTIR